MPHGEVADWFKAAALKAGTVDAPCPLPCPDLPRLVAWQTRLQGSFDLVRKNTCFLASTPHGFRCRQHIAVLKEKAERIIVAVRPTARGQPDAIGPPARGVIRILRRCEVRGRLWRLLFEFVSRRRQCTDGGYAQTLISLRQANNRTHW